MSRTTIASGGVSLLRELTRAYRRRLGLTQEELAERTGLSSRAIRAIENGRSRTPRPATVRLLADAFGLTGTERDRYVQAASVGQPDPADPTASTSPAAAERPGDGRPPQPVPRELPAPIPGFVGREEHLARLTAVLDDGAPGPVLISGTGGVGKTALAVHWAHRAAHRFPDGQLFVDLRGFGPAGASVEPEVAIRGFLQALGVPPPQVPADLDRQAALYRSLLAGRRMLLVVDNARDADQVRPLIPGAADSLMLVTSRRPLTSLVATDGAVPLTVELLTVQESRQLLAGRLGRRRVVAEPDAVHALIERCDRLPLALAVVAARATTRSAHSLASLDEHLRSSSRLDGLHGGDARTDVRTVFSWSYHQLADRSARLFRLLGVHPGPDVGVPAAASLLGHDRRTTQAALAELTDVALVAETAPGRYALHDLLRSFAADLADRIDPAPDRRAALHRVLDHYLRASDAAQGLLSPNRAPCRLPPPAAGTSDVHIVDHDDAMAWFTREVAVLLAVQRLAAEHGFDTHVWQLASSVHTFLYRRGRLQDGVAVQRAALDAAKRLASGVAQAHSQYLLGRALVDLNHLEAAREHLGRAYCRYYERGDVAGAARAQQIIGITFERQGDPRQGLSELRSALDLAREAGDSFLQGRFLNGIGWLLAHLGDHAEARAYCERALILMLEIDDRDGAADAWDSIGFTLHHLREYAEAAACYERALRLYDELGHRYYLALTLTHLAETRQAQGRPDLAREAWRTALDILTELGHPDATEVRSLLAGSTAAAGASRGPTAVPRRPATTGRKPGSRIVRDRRPPKA